MGLDRGCCRFHFIAGSTDPWRPQSRLIIFYTHSGRSPNGPFCAFIQFVGHRYFEWYVSIAFRLPSLPQLIKKEFPRFSIKKDAPGASVKFLI